MLKGIKYEDAIELLAGQPVVLKKETKELKEALGRILAEDITALFPMPPFDRSPFDGYAFNSADVPGRLRIEGESFTGCEELMPLSKKTAMRIFTGAPVPEGADGVLKQEETEVSEGFVTIPVSVPPGFNIIKKGENYPEGCCLLKAGTRLGAAELGVLASQGIKEVPVYKKPEILFISTGTELSAPGEPRKPYGIYNSSYYSLSAYLRMMNFEVNPGGTVEDDRTLIVNTIRKGLESDMDLVITTGGASVGDYDFASDAAKDLQMDILFWKVSAKPGAALMAAKKDGKLLISLSGNPAAAMMSILVVLQPFLRKLTGSDTGNEELTLPLLREFPKKSRIVRMLRGHSVIKDGITWFEENEGQGNSNIASFEKCTMIGIIPPSKEPLPAGTAIRVLRLPSDLCL